MKLCRDCVKERDCFVNFIFFPHRHLGRGCEHYKRKWWKFWRPR